MTPSNDYPWYVQHEPKFAGLYDELFNIVSMASPLGIGDAFYIPNLQGQALVRMGMLWGLQGAPAFYNGLIFGVDKWSDLKVWSGQMEDLAGDIYKRFVMMHAYINGRHYDLQLIKDAFDILLGDAPHTVTVVEEYMSFKINLSAAPDTLRIIQQLQSYDRHFLGKPAGISYTFNYIPMGQ